ncbi:MAG: SUMF1/EgtB/PvdO family nonheme iron enzyme [Planctomycetes bacterium]|nr:SUMF1/EgtB/PvdO family nonheme iron enzyme [Planctomycetota bacterium]
MYDEYHRRTQGGETLDFEALCARHPEHEAELRRLHAREQQRARMRAFGGLDRFEEPDPRATAILSELRSRGATIDRYRRLELLGEGGMGKVYEAEDTLLGRRVALKVISDRTRTEELLPLFDREMRIAAKLNHPGVGQVLDAGVDGTGRAFFAMTLVRGTDLSKCLELARREKDGWSITRVIGVLRQVADTMSYVHSCKILHRDLKPANIRVGKFGEVFVMDWGVAKALGEADPSVSGSDASSAGSGALSGTTVKGTPQYTSPELLRGEVETLEAVADVYSLGAILYEVLAGYAPYTTPGEKTSSERVLTRMSAGPVDPLSEVAKAQPRELVDICEKAMAARGSSRYRDMAELSADLRAYLEGRPVPSIEGGAWVELRKWVLRNKPLAASMAGGMLVLVLGIVYSTMKTREVVAANLQLSAETKRANEKTVEAERNATAAQDNAALAQRNEEAATQKARDVLSLSAIQDLQDLVDDADRLWPAHPDMLDSYEAWLEKARVLIEGRAGDAARGVSPKPSLADHQAKLRELEARALPQTEDERERERAAHPRSAELASMRAKAQWMARMLGREPWPSEAEVEAALVRENSPKAGAGAPDSENTARPLPTDANGLNELAWPLVDPDAAREVFGDEVKALILARRAVAAAKEGERHTYRDTLAWALFRNGRFDEALAEEKTALSEAPDKEKEAYEGHLKMLGAAVEVWRAPSGELREARTEEWQELASVVAELQRDVNRRLDWTFASSEDRWWHVQLSKLVRDLRAFTDDATGGLYSSGTSADHSWGIMKRAEFARTIEERTVSGPEAQRRWNEAIKAVADNEKYAGVSWPSGARLTPQLGLIPIGEDPHSRLWEFAEFTTGDEPKRGANGNVRRDEQDRLLLEDSTGLVFVLVPGGTFTMGAQSNDPTTADYDPQSEPDELPPHAVTLSPYFVSKYEMTQGQWQRLTGRNPSQYTPTDTRGNKRVTLLHPVERVSWIDSDAALSRIGLSLPTEAQWEHASRATTTSAWWTGDDIQTLDGVENLADGTLQLNGAPASWDYEDWLDGYVVHAPVGTYRANPFGLFDVHGNVREWCRDGYGHYEHPERSGDGERQMSDPGDRVIRGGGWDITAKSARSSNRDAGFPSATDGYLGLRPSRVITGPITDSHSVLKFR